MIYILFFLILKYKWVFIIFFLVIVVCIFMGISRIYICRRLFLIIGNVWIRCLSEGDFYEKFVKVYVLYVVYMKIKKSINLFIEFIIGNYVDKFVFYIYIYLRYKFLFMY